MLASVDPKQCVSSNLCGAIYVGQSTWCNLFCAIYIYGAIHVVQSMWCNPCGAIDAVQCMWCNRCGAI